MLLGMASDLKGRCHEFWDVLKLKFLQAVSGPGKSPTPQGQLWVGSGPSCARSMPMPKSRDWQTADNLSY